MQKKQQLETENLKTEISLSPSRHFQHFNISASCFLLSAFLIFGSGVLGDEISPLVRYEGKLTFNEAPVNGSVEFKFAFLTDAGQIIWNNDFSQSNAAAVPERSVSLTITNGTYATVLGDSAIMRPIEPPLLSRLPGLKLRIWVRSPQTGWQQLQPDEPLNLMAAQIAEAERAASTRLFQETLSELKQLRLQLAQLQSEQRRGDGRSAPSPSPPVPQKAIMPLPSDHGQFLGSPEARVIIMEFSDAECYYCKRFVTATFPQIKAEFIDTGKVRFVSRSFPLDTHPNARDAAKAAFCAGKQRKYWAMREELFKNSDQLVPEFYEKIAKDIGLDSPGFAACFGSPEAAEAVNQDVAEANTAGVTGTPSFIIGRLTTDGKLAGEVVVGANPFREFETRLVALLTAPETKP